jgi:hypothetical protein
MPGGVRGNGGDPVTYSMLFFGKVFKGNSRKYKNFTREHGQTITQVPKKYFAQLRGRIKAL